MANVPPLLRASGCSPPQCDEPSVWISAHLGHLTRLPRRWVTRPAQLDRLSSTFSHARLSGVSAGAFYLLYRVIMCAFTAAAYDLPRT